MEERTRAYLRGRFRDYYRRNAARFEPPTEPDDRPADADAGAGDEPSPAAWTPPETGEREWGYIPWTEGPGTTMVRHRSLFDLGNLADFLRRERPRHVYFSAGRYDDPGASTMEAKGWTGADLVFDLDADHLRTVTLGEDSYAEMLAKCKTSLLQLLDFLESDFGFETLSIAFSGGRGYHVHVRDPGVQALEREHRREIVDYVQGVGLDFETLIRTESVGGLGLKNPVKKRSLDVDGGWGRRAHAYVMSFVDDLLAMDETDALSRLQEFDGIGEGRAKSALTAARTNREEIRAGNIDVHPAFYQLARTLTEQVVDAQRADIDEPVTTDTRRLIRLPGSLHGGSGLVVTPIDRDDLADFDPLVDAVPETFVGHDIVVEVSRGGTVELNGETFTVPEGEVSLPEYVAVFLMARGRAEKGRE